jgi:tetratricopeptide (TPR) repeat protein
VLLVGEAEDEKEVKDFAFEVDRKIIANGLGRPLTGAWDTIGFKPGKHELTFRARLGRELMRSKPVAVELVGLAPGSDVGTMCREQRLGWAFGVATFENASKSETGAWLSVAFPEYLLAAAAHLSDLPWAARGQTRDAVAKSPVWVRRPPSGSDLKTLAGEGREACVVGGVVETGPGPESPSLPVTVTARVWRGQGDVCLLNCQVRGPLSGLSAMQADLATTVLASTQLYRKPAETERVRTAIEVKAEAYRALNRALAAADQGQSTEASGSAQEAATLEPDNPAVRIALGEVRLIQKDYVGALDAFEEACRLAADDAGALETGRLWLLTAANLGGEQYRPEQTAERWRCAKVAIELDPSFAATVANWTSLARVMEPTPENLRRTVELGESLLRAQQSLPPTGAVAAILENVVLAQLNLKQDAQAAPWFDKAKQDLELLDYLRFSYRVYGEAEGRERERIGAGSDLIAFGPADESAALVRELTALVRKVDGQNAARAFLQERADQVWKKVSAPDSGADAGRAAEQLAGAWGDLGDQAKQAAWAAKAAEAK